MLSFLSAVVVLGVLIIVHELGHFTVCKLAGIGVERFSIGFGPKVWARTVNETEYRLAAIPLGGYVKMVGEEDAMLENASAAPLPEGEERPKVDPAKAFNRKPVPVRMAVVAAGPIFNLLLAVFIFTVVFIAGVPVPLATVGKLQEGMPAAEAGLKTGDRVLSFNGQAIEDWDGLSVLIHDSPGREATLVVRRGSEELTIRVTPRVTSVKDLFGEEMRVGLIGISPSGETMTRRYGPFESLKMGFVKTWEIIRLTFMAVAKIFQRVIPANTIGGPLMIVQLAGEQAKVGILSLISLIAFLSVNLGIFNLLPIPILDGGHLLFFAIEGVRGKPVPVRQREIVQQVGLVLLGALFLFAFYNDVMRIAAGWFKP